MTVSRANTSEMSTPKVSEDGNKLEDMMSY